MKLDIEFLELKNPLFLGSINLGTKISSVTKGKKLNLWYDTDLGHTVIVCDNKVALVKEVSSMTLYDPSQIGVKVTQPTYHQKTTQIIPQTDAPAVSGPERTFQTAKVSTPISQPPRRPGRPPKFQGEEVKE